MQDFKLNYNQYLGKYTNKQIDGKRSSILYSIAYPLEIKCNKGKYIGFNLFVNLLYRGNSPVNFATSIRKTLLLENGVNNIKCYSKGLRECLFAF